MGAGPAYSSAVRQSPNDGDVAESVDRRGGMYDSCTAAQRPPVVKAGELESMDRLGGQNDCWARGVADVDYSQRLVFSDDEDFVDKRFANLIVFVVAALN